MPCYDDRDSPQARQEAQTVALNVVKKQLNLVTAIACSALNYINQFEGTLYDLKSFVDESDFGVSGADIQKWWDDHNTKDKERKEKERLENLIKSAKSKLTKEELLALGIK